MHHVRRANHSIRGKANYQKDIQAFWRVTTLIGHEVVRRTEFEERDLCTDRDHDESALSQPLVSVIGRRMCHGGEVVANILDALRLLQSL